MVSLVARFRIGYRERVPGETHQEGAAQVQLRQEGSLAQSSGAEGLMFTVRVEPIGYVVGLWKRNFHQAPGKVWLHFLQGSGFRG